MSNVAHCQLLSYSYESGRGWGALGRGGGAGATNHCLGGETESAASLYGIEFNSNGAVICCF